MSGIAWIQFYVPISGCSSYIPHIKEDLLYGYYDFISFVNKGISLSEIEKTGISTKGEGRGIGLCNVRKILEDYKNVSKMTEITDNYFSQTLVIEKMPA